MSVNSNKKGSRGERQACKTLEGLGEIPNFGEIEARRAQQYSGVKVDENSADILTNIECIRFEVKVGYNDTDLYNKQFQNWINQAKVETPEGQTWCILRKKDYQKFTAIACVEGMVVQTTNIKKLITYLINKHGSNN